jgi:hypothetical protein
MGLIKQDFRCLNGSIFLVVDDDRLTHTRRFNHSGRFIIQLQLLLPAGNSHTITSSSSCSTTTTTSTIPRPHHPPSPQPSTVSVLQL